MHTETSPRQHRHFVAAPLIMAVLLSSVVPVLGQGSVRAELTTVSVIDAQHHAIRFRTGLSALIEKGTQVAEANDGMVLLAGSALVANASVLHVQAGPAELTGFDGAFYASYQSPVLTVAAISTPVYVRMANGIAIVPVGRQWRISAEALPAFSAGWEDWITAHETKPLPASFIQEQRAVAQTLDASARSGNKETPAADLVIGKLPAARQRLEQAQQEGLGGTIHALVQSGDAVSLQSLLTDPAVNQLTSDERLSLLSSDASPSVLLAVQPLVSADATSRLLLSFHPAYRQVFLADALTASTDPEESALRLLLLPASDTLPTPLPPVLRSQYLAAMQSFLRGQKQPLPMLYAFIRQMAEVQQELSESQYPERHAAYGDAIRQFLPSSSDVVPADITAIAASFRSDVIQASQSVSSASVSSAPCNAAKPSDPVDRTRNFLQEAGALFTVQTSLTILDAHDVRVESVAFSTGQGDRLLSFTVDYTCQMLKDMTVDGQKQPLSMSMEAFGKWVRTN